MVRADSVLQSTFKGLLVSTSPGMECNPLLAPGSRSSTAPSVISNFLHEGSGSQLEASPSQAAASASLVGLQLTHGVLHISLEIRDGHCKNHQPQHKDPVIP